MDRPIVVLKFGSSVLESSDSLPIAVAEIYQHYRAGTLIVAVVSAYSGVTNTLLASARQISADPDPKTLAALMTTGEISSGAHLTLALHRAGISAWFVDPRDLGLTATGDRSNGALTGIDRKAMHARLEVADVLVVPGFFAGNPAGGVALLGRGGSDLTAMYLADVLRARCILLKDVDGLYEWDPAQAGPRPRQYVLANYDAAEAHAGSLVQPKALQFARERALSLDIARVGSSRHTRIQPGPTVLNASAPETRVTVALLGLGTVGGGVLEYLQRFPQQFQVVAALVRSRSKYAGKAIPKEILTDSIADVMALRPQIVVDALPGVEPASAWVAQALARGARVVTANKAMLASEWHSLAAQMRGPERQLRFAACVGGGTPMLETIERLKQRAPIVRLRGVLNGTSNFVLERWLAGDSFAGAITRAQDEGYAEADPSEDLSGRDSARKIELLGRVAFGSEPTCLGVEGLTDGTWSLPQSAKTRVRLVAEAHRTLSGFDYRVGLRTLPADDYLAGTHGVGNRIEVTVQDGEQIRVSGLGAGRIPTATAVFADVLEHLRVIEADAMDSDAPDSWVA